MARRVASTMGRLSRWGSVGLVVLLATLSPLLQAASASLPSTEPLLRIETGMHTTLIRRIVVDALRNRIISGGDDKTVRVWQMPEARLLSVLRVPIAAGHEGRIYAMAVSPDGETIAVAGWTGWEWEGKASVYLFDSTSGELVRRFSGLPDVVSNLVWMPDGKHLMVGLMGRGGVHLLRYDDLTLVASDSAYNDKVQEIDLRRDGIAVAVSLDGMVRLYDGSLKLLGRNKVEGGKLPTTVRFSPDGAKIAVGFADTPNIALLATNTLQGLRRLGVDEAEQQASFYSVAWSSDGRYLYGGGEYRGEGKNPLYRWGLADGEVARIPLAANRITEIMQMAQGQIAFATEDPSIGVLGSDQRVTVYRGPDIIDYSRMREQILLSGDGMVVGYPNGTQGGTRHTFSPALPGDQDITHPPKQVLSPPTTEATGWRLEGMRDSFKPSINGHAPALDDYEMVRSHAITPDRKGLLIGTEWALRMLDGKAHEKWRVSLPAVAWGVNISANGRLAVAALSDGTIRWYRVEDGQEVIAYFPLNDGKEWIAWLPNGYYLSSVNGDNYIGWHVNRGKAQAADFYRAVQFDRILYRPDLIRAQVAPYAATVAVQAGATDKAEFDIARLAEIAPPRLRLELGKVDRNGGYPTVEVKVVGERGALAMRDVTLFVNNIPVSPTASRTLRGEEQGRFSRVLKVALDEPVNTIRVEAFNGISMGVAERFVDLPDGVAVAPRRGDLYLVAVGVNEFPRLSPDTALAYAALDAEAMAKVLGERGGAVFNKVHIHLVNDHTTEKPDREVIRQALQFVQRAQAEDTVVLFLASHGISDAAGNYYFVPRDAIEADIDRLLDGGEIESLMPWTTFFDQLRLTAGKRLLIVDTCQARNIEGRFESHSLMKRSAASRFSLMLASKGDEESQEHATARHGLFTYSILEAMSGKSDGDGDGRLTLQELFEGAAPILEQNRDKRIGPQTPQLIAPVELPPFPLVGVGG